MKDFDGMTLEDKIQYADTLLPGESAPEGESNPRWEAMLEIADHLEDEPEPIWYFIKKWGVHEHKDTRMGIACCILEDLIGYHFDQYFPRVEELVKQNRNFFETVHCCYKTGQSKIPENSARLDKLVDRPYYDASRNFNAEDAPPCPQCGEQLRTKLAKQCFSCGTDWH